MAINWEIHGHNGLRKGKIILFYTMKTNRASRGIAAFILDLGTRWMWAVSFMPQPLYPREVTLVPIEQEAGWATEPIWMIFSFLAGVW